MSSSPSLKEVVEKKDSEYANNSSGFNSEGGGNNSDNSGFNSLGNASFGFNFESDEGRNNWNGSGSGSNHSDGDSDQGDRKMKVDSNKDAKPPPAAPAAATESTSSSSVDVKQEPNQPQAQSQTQPQAPSPSEANSPMSAGAAAARLVHKPESQEDIAFASGTQQEAAATAVANLSQIAIDAVKKVDALNDDAEKRGSKRKSVDTGGYKTDLEGEKLKTDTAHAGVAKPDSATSSSATGGKKKKLDEGKREERNAREKERSFRISKQINELRSLLSSGGVIVPKGTKSSVLTEAANYIRMLQQHQYRSEIDRHQLVQQVQRIGSGAIGPQAAQAVRHVAAQNGVWSLGNFGGVPPKSAMSTIYHPNGGAPHADETQSNGSSNGPLSNKVEEADYRHVFNSCTIGMAIASMGGAFIDCNKFFCQISNFTKQEICSQTIFNLTARQDLQSAFDLISQMLSAPLDPTVTNTSCVLRGALRERPDIGLSVKLIKASDGVAKCFCVTLIQNPTSAFDNSRPIPATITVQGQVNYDTKDPSRQALDQAPAYTAG